MIAASNLLEKLDPALLRPGRFDRQIFVSPPDVERPRARSSRSTRATSRSATTSTSTSSPARPAGLTGADLANICNEAAIFAARRSAAAIATQDFDAALERVVAGMQSRRALNDHEKRVVAYHEAGHALCARAAAGRRPRPPISIVPRGRALGYTLNLPDEDRYLKTREELIDHMTMLLGGRAAEQIVFGASPPAPSDDLAAGRRDRPRDGPRLRDGHALVQLAARSRRRRRVSEPTRALRDEEQQELADEALPRGASC